MKITDALLGEHGVIHQVFARAEEALGRARHVDEARAIIGFVDDVLRSHAKVEDDLLFPALETAIGAIGPMAVMRMEHQEIEEALDDAAGAEDLEDAIVAVTRAIEVARPHFHKEEIVLFRLAVEAIPAAELERLGRLWGERRKIELPDPSGPDPKPATLRRGQSALHK